MCYLAFIRCLYGIPVQMFNDIADLLPDNNVPIQLVMIGYDQYDSNDEGRIIRVFFALLKIKNVVLNKYLVY